MVLIHLQSMQTFQRETLKTCISKVKHVHWHTRARNYLWYLITGFTSSSGDCFAKTRAQTAVSQTTSFIEQGVIKILRKK